MSAPFIISLNLFLLSGYGIILSLSRHLGDLRSGNKAQHTHMSIYEPIHSFGVNFFHKAKGSTHEAYLAICLTAISKFMPHFSSWARRIERRMKRFVSEVNGKRVVDSSLKSKSSYLFDIKAHHKQVREDVEKNGVDVGLE